MGYNHGYALKKHKEMWKKAEEEYRQLGMTEEQINAIYEMEKAELNSDRVYYEKLNTDTPERQSAAPNIASVDINRNSKVSRPCNNASCENRYFRKKRLSYCRLRG